MGVGWGVGIALMARVVWSGGDGSRPRGPYRKNTLQLSLVHPLELLQLGPVLVPKALQSLVLRRGRRVAGGAAIPGRTAFAKLKTLCCC